MTTNTVDALILLSSPEAARDPYPVLARLREEEPVHRTPAGFWLVSRHADAQALLAGDALRAPEQLPAAGGHASLAMRLDTMLLKDGAEHARLRRLVARDFTPRRVEGLRARMAAICDRLLDTVAAELHDGGESDLHRSLSVPFTLQVFSELLGVPEGDRAELAECVQDIVAAFGSGRPDQLAVADARTEHLTGYFRELAAARAAEPQDDLVSALVRARDDDPDRLAERELLATLWALWIVGFETTAAALDHGVLALLAHPELPLDDGFVAEVLRWSGPALFSSIPASPYGIWNSTAAPFRRAQMYASPLPRPTETRGPSPTRTALPPAARATPRSPSATASTTASAPSSPAPNWPSHSPGYVRASPLSPRRGNRTGTRP